MNKKLFGLMIFAVAFALVSGLNMASAASFSDSYNRQYTDQINLFGVDEANNGGGFHADRDAAPHPAFDTYGLNGSLRP